MTPPRETPHAVPGDPTPPAAVPGDPDPEGGAAEGVIPDDGGSSGRARNTIIFSVATGLSRVAGLIREIFSNALYGGGAIASAFTIAFAVPNLLRALFADMALSAAFVPVFTALLEKGKRREALLLLSTLFWVLLAGLTILVGVAMLTAPLYMPLFVGDEVTANLGASGDGLTVGLSQVMLPTVLLLGLNGLFVGALNAYDHFTIPALSPLLWNFVIIVVNLALLPAFGGTGSTDGIYAQAIGVLVGTLAQLLIAIPVLRRYGIRLVPKVDLHDPRLRQVLVLMVPVAISLGLINFSALIDSVLASRVQEDGPRAIEAAFRLYMLPQGVFSVAIVTVLFPVLARAVAREDRAQLRGLIGTGMAQILVLLVPLGLLFASPVISHDILEVLFERGRWTAENTDSATTALVWLGISLALNGVSLLLSRTFFALQRPWANTGLAMGSLVANIAVSVALYRPLGIAGIVIGTFVGNVVLVGLQIRLLQRETGGPLGLLPVVRSLLQVLVASVLAVLAATAVVLIGGVATDALGDGTVASVLTVIYLGAGLLAGTVVYVGLAHELGLRELEQAAGRFVRLGVRLRALLLRLPGAARVVEISGRPTVRRAGGGTERALGWVAWPLGPITAGAVVVSRLLVGLVPDGPAVAVAGPGPGGVGPGGGGSDGTDGGGARPDGGGGSPPGGRRPRGSGPRPGPSGGATGVRGSDPEGGAGDGQATADEPVTQPRPPRGRGASRVQDSGSDAETQHDPRGPRPASRPASRPAGPQGPADDATRQDPGRRGPTRQDAAPQGPSRQGPSGEDPSSGGPARRGADLEGPASGGSSDPGPSSENASVEVPARPEPAREQPSRTSREPAVYDAAEDWPTIGQRGGETLDVPWPGVERDPADDDPFDEPSWDDDVAPSPGSRLEAYGIDRPKGGLTPEQRARIEERDRARRLIDAREDALARMAERQRRRREAEEKPGRRGRKGR